MATKQPDVRLEGMRSRRRLSRLTPITLGASREAPRADLQFDGQCVMISHPRTGTPSRRDRLR